MKHTIYADLDTMVFEGREKNYGAYHIRKEYNRILNRSMLIAMLLFLSLTGLPKVIKWIIPAEVTAPHDPEPDMMTEVTWTDLPKEREKEIEEPPLPPEIEEKQPKIEEAVKTIMLTVIEPSPDEDPDLIVHEMDSLLIDDKAIGNLDQDGKDFDNRDIPWDDLLVDGPGGPGEVGPVFDDEPSPEDFFIGEDPRPINMDAFKESVGYPTLAVEAGIVGKVIVRVMVDELGFAKKHIVLKDPHPILTKAVSQKVNELRFTPGIQNNKPVKVWVTIPVDFVLNN